MAQLLHAMVTVYSGNGKDRQDLSANTRPLSHSAKGPDLPAKQNYLN